MFDNVSVFHINFFSQWSLQNESRGFLIIKELSKSFKALCV